MNSEPNNLSSYKNVIKKKEGFILKVLINLLTLFSIILFNCFSLYCQESANGSPNNAPLDPGKEVFENSFVELFADTEAVLLDRLTTITIRCKPLFTGKGRIKFQTGGAGTSLVIESPVQDTISAMDSIRWKIIHVGFTANETFEQEWKIRLINQKPYSFTTWTILDSIYIADSSRMFHIDSEEAKALNPAGYIRTAASYGINLTYP